MPRDWENIYKDLGDLGYKILPRIKRAAGLFRVKGVRNILDMGCGTGRHSLYLAGRGFRVYASDMSQTAVKIAAEKAAKLGLDIQFLQHDMRDIPFGGSFFDAVICTWTLHHGTLAQIQKTVDEVHRVLVKSGIFLTDIPSVTTAGAKNGREIEKNTVIGKGGGEEDVPHHYTNREEIIKIFSRFRELKVRLQTTTEYYRANKAFVNNKEGIPYESRRFNIEAVK
jgi:ubiquinone/menaquinone biosynthesis C-methylase UbiE